MQRDELEEDDFKELYRLAPYFDGGGRLILEHDGVQYLIDSDDEDIGVPDGRTRYAIRRIERSPASASA